MTNVTMSILMAVTCIIGTWSMKEFNNASNQQPVAEKDVRAVALSLFTVLGLPLAVNFPCFIIYLYMCFM
jgi:hypothetical protein